MPSTEASNITPKPRIQPIFDWTSSPRSTQNGATETSPQTEKLKMFRLRVDAEIGRLLDMAEMRFEGLETTGIIRRCARWIRKSTTEAVKKYAEESEYKKTGTLKTTLYVRNCDDTGLDADTFRKCLHHYLSDALAAPQQEKFVPSANGMKLVTEAEITQMCMQRKHHRMPKGNYYTIADAAIAFGVSKQEED